jgi:hypothetical protein
VAVAAKARAFLQRAKDKNIEDIKKKMGNDISLYEAIAASNKKASVANNLLGASKMSANGPPGFLDIGDGRITAGGLRLDISAKKTFFTSFDQNWCCIQCGNHGLTPAFKIRGLPDSSCARQVIILGDQACPAILPAAGDLQCIRTLLQENGSVSDLCDEFLRLLGNRRVPQGSTILIFSASHLANVGLAAYCSDLLKARDKIWKQTGNKTVVGPLPPILLGGSNNAELIRNIFELVAWSNYFFKSDDNYLEDSHATACTILLDAKEGDLVVGDIRRYTLPADKTDGIQRVWVSGGQESKAMPCSIKALTPASEKLFFDAVIDELRRGQGLDLDPLPTLDRIVYNSSHVKRKIDIVIVGSSNASKLADILIKRGKSVMLIHEPHWVICRPNVEMLATRIHKEIQITEPGLIILQFFDNSCFFAKREDGSRTLPVRMEDGGFHMIGDVVVCSQEAQVEQFRTLMPIFSALGGRPTLCISPLPRFVAAGCCNNTTHAANRRDDDYRETMTIKLDAYRRHLKDFTFSSGFKNIKVMDPSMDLKGMGADETWGDDPVHPKPEVYNNIATGVLKMAANMADMRRETSGNKRRRTDSQEDSNAGRSSNNRGENLPGSYSDRQERQGHHYNHGQSGRGAYGGPRPYNFNSRARPYTRRY